MSEVHTPTKVFPLRCYYAKRVGRRWQVWFSHQHPSDDGEWMACSAKYWRWINAVRAANSLWAAFNDGIWIEGGRALARAAIAKAEPSEPCRMCRGKGTEADYVGLEMQPVEAECGHCNGSGLEPTARAALSRSAL